MLMEIFVVNIATPPWILALQSRDQTAMFSVETIAKCRSSLMESKDVSVIRYCSFHQHGRLDVSCKISIRTICFTF